MTTVDDFRKQKPLKDDRAADRETAMGEILRIISLRRDDEQPVFEVILENTLRLCNASDAVLGVISDDGTELRFVAGQGKSERYLEWMRNNPISLADPESSLKKMVDTLAPVHIPDLRNTDRYWQGRAYRRKAVDEMGLRAMLQVPLARDGRCIGTISIGRNEAEAFTGEEISLLETFATQAVIALDNVRQFRDVQARNAEIAEALEQQTATADLLKAISKSAFDLPTVLQEVIETAARLCGASICILFNRKADGMHMDANVGCSPEMVAFHTGNPNPIDRSNVAGRAVLEKQTVHLADVTQDPDYKLTKSFELGGWRSIIAVPLLRNGEVIAVLALSRPEVGPFSPRQIELVEIFADQAVIAINNANLFTEVQQRLEREAATREILQVISRSRDDESPVFKSILEHAQRLCGAPFGNLNMVSEDGARLEIMVDGIEVFEPFRPGWSWPIESGLLVARSVRECAVLQLEEAAADPLYSQGDTDRVTVVNAGVRTVLTVPLVSNGIGIGSIGLYRREKRLFTPDEIDLVQTFADQAVIAIENVRQFKALQERTDEVQALNASLEIRVNEQVGEIERMGRLKRFLSPAVAEAVVTQGEDMLSSHRALIATLFCDIRGFTAFCETAEPEETIEVLQTYHEEMGHLISVHNGGVDKRMGDGVMVVFNDPLPCEDPAGDALRMALAMREKMAELSKKWKRLGHRLGFGVGISLGYATVGMVGSAGRYEYTASGTAVNLAARLCDEADDGEILLSPRAYTAVEDDFSAEARGEIAFKGIKAPVEVFRVIGRKGP